MPTRAGHRQKRRLTAGTGAGSSLTAVAGSFANGSFSQSSVLYDAYADASHTFTATDSRSEDSTKVSLTTNTTTGTGGGAMDALGPDSIAEVFRRADQGPDVPPGRAGRPPDGARPKRRGTRGDEGRPS